MSDEVYTAKSLYVTRYVGPTGPADRRRWQFTIAAAYPSSQAVSLDAEQARALYDALGRSLKVRGAP